MKTVRGWINFLEPIFVDYFASGGDWSTGMELTLGRVVDIAINHDPDAVLMHQTNHPFSRHYWENIFAIYSFIRKIQHPVSCNR